MSDTDEDKPTGESSKLRTNKNVTVVFKLNGKNYPLWARLMKVAIGSRRGYSHIYDEPPEPNSKGYRDWEETDLIVFSWIVDNIENDIIADFAHHQTSKALWDNLAITFESKTDPYQIYDLEDKIIYIRQGNLDLETYYRRIHGLWVNIDRSQKQPVTCCDKGIWQYRQHTSEKRLIKFLTGLNQEYDHIRQEILKEQPYPSVEEAYGWDIQTRKIIERGTENQGLYYVDGVAQHGSAMLAQGSTREEACPLIEEPTETIAGIAAKHASTPESTQPPLDQPQPISQVCLVPISEENVVVDTNTAEEEDNTVDGDTGKYVLPYRSTRGIPLKRYSPEKIGAKSRYGVANFVQGNLSKMT
ncbi:uncharacterized protein LOC121774522 [Salvia splendens]|uniref:uncharacterized protein LOC121774522 n=1 Tax=Salvia splendens TaxID=180675 RepID=UPI001C26B20A|nr:uncharacterized protein LOC121774522 [Salvia splendens]